LLDEFVDAQAVVGNHHADVDEFCTELILMDALPMTRDG